VSFPLRNLLFGVVAMVVSMAANAASVTLVDVANSQNRDGFYAGFYTLKVNGQDILAMCDDFTTNTTLGENWTANIYNYSDVNSGAGKFGPNPVLYSQVGYLYSLAPSADYTNQADIDNAIWKIMDPSVLLANANATSYYNTATSGAYDTFNWSAYMQVLTPQPLSSSQEFLIPAAPVPLPATAWLFGSGLLGLGALGRRKRST